MFSNIFIPITIISFICSAYGYYCLRKSNPRFALLSTCAFIISLGLWVLSSTIELAIQGQAHDFLRSFNKVFSKVEHPKKYLFSVIVHSTLGFLGILFGIVGVWIIKKKLNMNNIRY